jgi:hypothetical protein
VHLRIRPPTKILPLILIIVLIISPLFIAAASSLQLATTSEYSNYVHTYINSSQGNYTYIEKPIFPVQINNSQIQIGHNWTIVSPLEAGHNYHVYCYGAWVNTSSAAKTDYDIYVYDPQGNLESSHTEAAGFPEHLGTTTNDTLFTPKQSGNYSFVIKNDLRESEGAQQATFMIMENLDCDNWHSTFIEGKNDNSLPSYRTSWAYEFVTSATYVKLFVKVPQSLDMYEARLYLMNDNKSLSINSYPLPWEPGLYGNLTGPVGGYNFESEAYRGVAYASCEFRGEPMFLNYTAPSNGVHLYHLVLIGEEGSGDLMFMLKTKFENVSLIPLIVQSRVYPNSTVPLAFSSNNTNLESAQLSYTTDNWTNTATFDMVIINQMCNGTISGQKAGSFVQYRIQATDVYKNLLKASGNYTVKERLTLNITAVKDRIRLGENITIVGDLTPNYNDSIVEVQFSSINNTQAVDCVVSSNGTFMASFQPDASGPWAVIATSPETQTSYRCDSQELTVTVTDPPIYIKYSLFIIAGLVVALTVGGVVYFLKFRER